MITFEVDSECLLAHVPPGTELDSFEGRLFVSVVGFRFGNTRMMGVPVPFHRDFDEVNLRFYVRRRAKDGLRRGVVFIKEIVPRFAIARIARWIYNENYVAMPMRSDIRRAGDSKDQRGIFRYEWRTPERSHHVEVRTSGPPDPPAAGSIEAFIAEHYWGYGVRRNGTTLEYRVEHPPWRVWRATRGELRCDAHCLYGADFAAALEREPVSIFVADGSEVTVRLPKPL